VDDRGEETKSRFDSGFLAIYKYNTDSVSSKRPLKSKQNAVARCKQRNLGGCLDELLKKTFFAFLRKSSEIVNLSAHYSLHGTCSTDLYMRLAGLHAWHGHGLELFGHIHSYGPNSTE
jgi:hypothetical protein